MLYLLSSEIHGVDSAASFWGSVLFSFLLFAEVCVWGGGVQGVFLC